MPAKCRMRLVLHCLRTDVCLPSTYSLDSLILLENKTIIATPAWELGGAGPERSISSNLQEAASAKACAAAFFCPPGSLLSFDPAAFAYPGMNLLCISSKGLQLVRWPMLGIVLVLHKTAACPTIALLQCLLKYPNGALCTFRLHAQHCWMQ